MNHIHHYSSAGNLTFFQVTEHDLLCMQVYKLRQAKDSAVGSIDLDESMFITSKDQ